jgi:predicted MPP superfamily phosphohydrolase
MHNPYNFNQPAEPPVFVGRGPLVEKIAEDLSSSSGANSWALIGGRHFGKGSLLKALHGRLMDNFTRAAEGAARVFPVLVHLSMCETRSERHIYLCILREIHRRLGQHAATPRALATAVASGEDCTFYGFQGALEEVTNATRESGGPLRLILLLNEVEKMMRYDWRDDFFNKLRSVVYDSDLDDRVHLVLTGSTRVAQAKASGSPLLNSVTIMHLKPLPERALAELIRCGGEVSPEVVAAVQEKSGGHPYIAQYLLKQLWDGDLSRASAASVSAAALQMRQERAGELQSWWEDIGEMGQRAYLLLSEVDDWQHEQTLLERVNDPLLPLDQALSALCYHGLAVRDESLQRYRCIGGLFRDWVNANKRLIQIERPAPSVSAGEPRTVTWLHLSDIHFKEMKPYDPGIVLAALLSDLKQCMERGGMRPDFIALTGDLAFSGKPAEYAHVRRFIDELLAVTGLPANRVFPVPGNHDVDRSLVLYSSSIAGQSLKDRDAVNRILGTPDERRLYFNRFKGYGEFLNDYFSGHLTFDDDNYFYVRMLELRGLRISLLGLNSSWLAESDEDETRKLVIGERQVREAIEGAQRANANLKIALFHHPMSWLRELEQTNSVPMLLDGCDYILHGHLHHHNLNQVGSPDGDAMVIAGGACYETRRSPNSFNCVRLDLTAGKGVIHFWRYSDERGGFWASDTMLYKNAPDGVYEFDLPARLRELSSAGKH